MDDQPTHPLGNTLFLLAPARFLLAWCLLASALSWTIPWAEWRGDNFLNFVLLITAPLLARFSPSLFGANIAAILFVGSAAFLYSARSLYQSPARLLLLLGSLSMMIAIVLRAVFALLSRLSLWRFIPTLFWTFLAWCWYDFYSRDLQHAQYRAILGVFPVFIAGFFLLRTVARRVGGIWLWASLALLSLGLGLLYGDNNGHDLLALASTPKSRVLCAWLVAAALVYLAAVSLKRVATNDTRRLLRDLHCGALFALAPLVVLLIWRDNQSGCFGMGRSFRETLFYTSTLLFFVGPSLFERLYWRESRQEN
jgi:hypothetical protein